ncbi:F-box DNA helicase 1 [Hondaea fermentalgiana]|uniref:DNA 3'-5' helicase n=1 Tax=Hondaea fermentalgiana TaxID=2315210 RepID=A0A2R5GSE2_9STRA|nr:F-box DNA helicase 1 [Hondaea fermentalgiana]|eukprot:GBG31563.1 F-box DNA helicase 1 [Hondaea fermentalgiana]
MELEGMKLPGNFGLAAHSSPLQQATQNVEDREEAVVYWEREPGNRFDRNAILVRNATHQDIGYIERTDSAYLATLLDTEELEVEHAVVLRPNDLASKVYPMLAVFRIRSPGALNLAADASRPRENRTTVINLANSSSSSSAGFASARSLAGPRNCGDYNATRSVLSPRCQEALDQLTSAINERDARKMFKSLCLNDKAALATKKRKAQNGAQATLFGPQIIKRQQQDGSRVARNCEFWNAKASAPVLQSLFEAAAFDFVDVWTRLRCVCRAWREVIESPSFMSMRKAYWRALHGARNPLSLPPLGPQPVNNLGDFAQALQRESPWLTVERAEALARLAVEEHDCGWQNFIATRQGKEDQRGELLVYPLLLGGSQLRLRLLQALLPRHVREAHRAERTELVYALVRILRTGPWAGSSYRWASVLADIEHGLFLQERATGLLVSSPEQSFVRRADPSKARTLTTEQLAIVQSNLAVGDVIVVRALAGTGKTTTLVNYARLRPETRFLYLAFNVSVGEEARTLFPENVKCTNLHKLSYARVGRKYKISEDLDARAVQQCDETRDLEHFTVFSVGKTNPSASGASSRVLLRLPKERMCKLVKLAVNAFVASADPELCSTHAECSVATLDEEDRAKYRVDPDARLAPATTDLTQLVTKLARNVWAAMCSKTLPMSSNGHLKLYQLQCPDLARSYDVIMLDEAQDCTPCARDLVMQQRGCARILIGDQNQAIYQFMGAQDALNVKKYYPEARIRSFLLSRCFRFGPNVAAVANGILQHCAHTSQILLGARPPVDEAEYSCGVKWDCEAGADTALFATRYEQDAQRSANARAKGTVAFISRSNRGLLEHALRVAHDMPKARFGIVGGLQASPLATLADLARLALRKLSEVESPLVRKFQSIDQVRAFAAKAKESDMSTLLGYLDQIEPETVVSLYARLQKQIQPWKEARYVMSTVHKAKGLEFDSVYLLSDFQNLVHVDELTQQLNIDSSVDPAEINLLYVAVTRAKRELFLNRSLRDLQAARPYLVAPILRSPDASTAKKKQPSCQECGSKPTLVTDGLELAFELQHVERRDVVMCARCAGIGKNLEASDQATQSTQR